MKPWNPKPDAPSLAENLLVTIILAIGAVGIIGSVFFIIMALITQPAQAQQETLPLPPMGPNHFSELMLQRPGESTIEELPDRVDGLLSKGLKRQCMVRMGLVTEGAHMAVAGVGIDEYVINLNTWMRDEAARTMTKWRSLNTNELQYLKKHWFIGHKSMRGFIKEEPTVTDGATFKLRAAEIGAYFYGQCMTGRLDINI